MGKLIKWDLDRAIKLLKKGLTCREISEVMGVPRNKVYDAFRNRNLKIVPGFRGIRASWDMERAKDLTDQGYPIVEVAKIMGIPHELIRSGFKNKGWKPVVKASGSKVRWDVEKAKKLRQKGLKWTEIDKEMNVARGTVRNYFLRKGLYKPRPRSGQPQGFERTKKIQQKRTAPEKIARELDTDRVSVRQELIQEDLLPEKTQPMPVAPVPVQAKPGGKTPRRKIPRIRMPLKALVGKGK